MVDFKLISPKTSAKKSISHVFGTVIGIKDDIFFICHCSKCKYFSKSSSLRCRKCDHVLQQYCYRLSLEIDTNLAVLPVTIVGNCLDKYFGVKSDEFYKKLYFSNDSKVHFLKNCVEKIFIGHLFCILMDNFLDCKLEEKSSNDLELVGVNIITIGSISNSTVFENYCNFICFCDNTNYKDAKQLFNSKDFVKTDKVELQMISKKGEPRNVSCNDSLLPNQSKANFFSIFNDSFMSSLIKKHNSFFSTFDLPNVTESQDNVESSEFIQNHFGAPLNKNKKIIEQDFKHSDNFFMCSFKSIRSKLHNQVSTDGSDILDVTLPVWSNTPQRKIKRKSASFVNLSCSSPVPKLRRCRSASAETFYKLENFDFSEQASTTKNKKSKSYQSDSLFVSPHELKKSKHVNQNKMSSQDESKIKNLFGNVSSPLTSSTPKSSEKRKSVFPILKDVEPNSCASFDLFSNSIVSNKLNDESSTLYSFSDNKQLDCTFDFSNDLFCK